MDKIIDMKRGCLRPSNEYGQWALGRQLVSELQANFYRIYDYEESFAETLANSIILNTQK